MDNREEDPVLPLDTQWLEGDELFEGDPIVSVPPGAFDSLLDSDKRVEDVENIVEAPPMVSKKRVGQTSSGGKGNGKQARLGLVVVDEENDNMDVETHGVVAPTNFGSGNFQL